MSVNIGAESSSGSWTKRLRLVVVATVLACVAMPASASAVSFSAATNFAAGANPSAVATGDFNADSNIDLAVANLGGNNVSILLGNGSGGFGSATNFTAGTQPRYVAVGQFNADSNQDLAVANGQSNNVSILLGTGSGTFGSATNFAVGTSPRFIALGQFNGDSNVDMAVPNNGSNNVSVLLGNGSGGFGTANNFTTGSNPRSVVAGNFDGDANLDLAVGNFGSNNVSILLGTGSGTFGSATNFAVGAGPFAITSGMFNGDANRDLAVANNLTNDVSILLGNGAGSFGTATNFSVGSTPGSVVTGEFSGDSNTDLAVSNAASNNVSILTGNGSGSFSSATNFAVGTTPAMVAVGQFNPGGLADLAVANGASGNVSVLLGKAEPSMSTTATANVTLGAAISDKATITGGASPGGTITFKAYGPGDATCSNSPAFTSSAVSVSGNGNYDSPSFTPSNAGTYRWIATYSGDSQNNGAAGACNDSGEASVVAKASPSISTTATANVGLGIAISDKATISGGHSPGGTIVFRAYGPGDATCSNAPAFTSSAVTVSGAGDYDSPNFTPSNAGTYRWIATYSGDADNDGAAGSCNEAGETSIVAKATPAISTLATATAAIGSTIGDRASISGGHNPGGTIVFRAYGPGDATCSNAPAFTSSAVSVSGNGDYDSPNFTPSALGTYRWIATYSGDSDNDGVAGACNDSGETSVVNKASPSLSTQATPAATVGHVISDKATISGGHNPGGTIVFRAYGPNDATCSNAPAFTSSAVSVSGNGDYDSPNFTPSIAGAYRWIATYSGDGDNDGTAGACNDANESSAVSDLPTPTITTSATATAPIGGSIGDRATLAAGSSPTGTITFRAYGPGDATCSNAPAFTSAAVSVSGNGDYDSPSFTPSTAGTYRWIATYSGDGDNNAAAGSCNDSGESSVITKAGPSMTTSATANVTIGSQISDKATISGGHSPGGTIVFRAYGPGDATCSNAPAFTSSAVTVSGAGDYDSPNFTPSTAGTYRWIATYSGDANNDGAAGSCNDAGETSVVAKASTSISTNATNGAAAGTIGDAATLTGGASPGGTITFRAYGPGDATCSNAPAFTSSAVSVSGNGNYSSPTFSPGVAGTFRWIATYSGDANNNGVAGSCNDANETSVVSKASPSISTTATANAAIGAAISDKATITGGASPGGTITFKAYGPGDATCSNSPAFTSSAVSVSGNGNYDSPSFTPSTAGTYRWIATYSGDANNDGTAGSCNDSGETSVVAKASPTISTSATANATIGAAISDQATIAGGHSPGGTITFKAYGPGDLFCAGTAAFTVTVNVDSGNGTYGSGSFSPSFAGGYRWIASYSGDADNDPVSGACNDANERSAVAKASPSLQTRASADVSLGAEISDHATISGGFNPGGSITFTAYGPDDPTCAAQPAFSPLPVTVSGNGSFDSPSFTPKSEGTYLWVASYSGDTNNQGAAGACGDAGESVSVGPRPDNAFTIGKPQLDKKKGTAKLPVSVPGAGEVVLSGKDVKPKTVQVGGASTVTFKVKATGRTAKKLKKAGKAKVKVSIRFTPTGGDPADGSKQVKLVRKR